MNTHYIPRLLLKRFARADKVNTFDFRTSAFAVKKLKNTFAEKDMFDEELETAFASKLEGPFGNLLNHKLLCGDTICIERKENLMMRKFLMINGLRAPIVNCSWEEMVERTRLQDHPSVQARAFLSRHNPEWKAMFDRCCPSGDSYIPDLKKAMELESLEEIIALENRCEVSDTLKAAAAHAMASVIAFWDCGQSGEEFILPKLPGISQMDYVSILYKVLVLKGRMEEKEQEGLPEELTAEFNRLIYGSMICSDNFSVYPLSPTRMMVCFSPYFRAFFPIMDPTGRTAVYPPLLNKAQFDRHFFEPMRMDLFKPCRNLFNRYYQYSAKALTAEETWSINALLLNMETEEFVFHDFNRIRNSFWYYDHRVRFASQKKHDFSRLE